MWRGEGTDGVPGFLKGAGRGPVAGQPPRVWVMAEGLGRWTESSPPPPSADADVACWPASHHPRSAFAYRAPCTLICQENQVCLEVHDEEILQRWISLNAVEKGCMETGNAMPCGQLQHDCSLTHQPGPPAALPGPWRRVQLQAKGRMHVRKGAQRAKHPGVCEEGAAAVQPHVQILDGVQGRRQLAQACVWSDAPCWSRGIEASGETRSASSVSIWDRRSRPGGSFASAQCSWCRDL